MRYRVYSEALKEKYGEKVYKLPVNLPVTCPNHQYWRLRLLRRKGRGL